MKLKILHLSLLFAATTAKDVYVEGATTDSPGAAAVVPAAKLGVNEAPAENQGRLLQMTKSAEEACENHDFSKAECQNVGCCEWYTCPITSVGGDSVGQCIGAAALNVFGPDACTSVPWRIAGRWDGPWCNKIDVKPVLAAGASNWGGCGAEKCDVCTGDCDSNADCKLGLSCFHRNGNTPVPSCKGTGKHDWDYCTWRY